MKSNLEWTGERMIDNVFLAKGVVEHLHRYAISLEFVKNKVVLDIACGEGYGSNLISKEAEKVYGIDISSTAINHAKQKYNSSNITFLEGSVLDIPLGNKSVDIAVSFETLEHVLQQEKMLSELNRVLKIDGLLIISTPEKENYQEIDPNNPFHLKELTYIEFEKLLKLAFKNVNIVQQKFLFSSQILNEKNELNEWVEYSGSFEKIHKRDFLGGHYFNVAICSNVKNLSINSSIFNGNILFRELEKKVYNLNQIKNTPTYRLGFYLISPFKFLKRIFKMR